jgi:hypothetical protein
LLADVGRVQRRRPGALQQLVVAGALGQLEDTVYAAGQLLTTRSAHSDQS